MKPLAIIFHAARSEAGVVTDIARLRNIPIREIHPYLGEAIPAPENFSAIVSLGGPQGAYQTDEYPYVQAEANFMTEAVDADIPLLGICLGSQILARAVGGSAHPGTNGLEAGVIEVGGRDGYEEYTGQFLSFHSDSVTLPPNAEVLAESDRYVQVWRIGSALGMQFHPELGGKGLESVLQHEAKKLKSFGVDVDALIEGTRIYSKTNPTTGYNVINSWFKSWEEQIAPVQLISQQGGTNG